MGKSYLGLAVVLMACLLSFETLSAQSGKDCNDPVVINNLPFHSLGLTTDGAGDDYNTSPCDINYITGNDYVLTYTPAQTEYVTIRLENVDAWTGLHLLDACPDVALTCIGSDNQSSAGIREIVDIELEGGTTYFIVVSSFAAPQSVDFDLHVLGGTPPAAGTNCANPKEITSLPFSETGVNTEEFGNVYSGTGPCAAEDENYLNGNEIVYLYTAQAHESVNLEIRNLSGFFAGVQILDACPDASPNCVASAFNAVQTNDLIIENLLLEKAQDYYIVVSTWENPPTVSFDISLTSNRSCFDPTNFSATQVTQTSALLDWEGEATNWNMQILPSGASPGPNGSKILQKPHLQSNLQANRLYDVYLQSNCKAANLMITGVYDGPLSGGNPKGVELYVLSDISDLSDYGIGSANNGEGSDGIEFTFPAVSAAAGTFLYWTSDMALFEQFFETTADYESEDALINGDDAVELYFQGELIDLYGDIDTDGTGQPWEYKDGWAYRRPGQENNDGLFDPSKWTYSGIDNLEGSALNATCDEPFPIGGFDPPPTLSSDWAGPFTFHTLPDPAECGGNFYDDGGSVAAYGPSRQDTFVICPDQPGFVVEIDFETFDVEANENACIDGLSIYDGDNTEAPLISPNESSDSWCWSTNDGQATGSGNLAGQKVRSSGPTGCLTFVFQSNDEGDHAGWEASVSCVAEEDCPGPEELMVSNITSSSADLTWINKADRGTSNNIVWGLRGISPLTGTLVSDVSAPYTLEGLEPSMAYSFYVQQDCDAFGSSEWTGPYTFISGCSSSIGDEMENPILVDALPFSSSGSTMECYTNTFGNPSSDAFYEVQTEECMTSIRISSCSEITDFDTFIRLLDSLGNEVAFNDDAAASDCDNQLTDFNRLSVLEARVSPNSKYFVMIEGFGPKEGSFEIEIEEGNLPPLELAVQQQDVSCRGEADGALELDIIGGVPPYEVLWSHGKEDRALSNLVAGIYQVTVSDLCGFTDELSVEITEPDGFVFSSDVRHESSVGQGDGSISLDIEGGEMPFTYEWSNGSTSRNQINLLGGQYCVTVTDGLGCQQNECFTVNSGLVHVEELDELRYIEIQPNPSSEESRLRVEFQEAVDLEISILNSLGQLVWKVEDDQVLKKTYRFDVRSFANGIYFVQLNYKNYVVSHKIVVEH